MHPGYYDSLVHHLRCPPRRVHVVPAETILIHGDEPAWRPMPADKATLPPEVSLRLAVWVLSVAKSFIPDAEASQRSLHNEIHELITLLARFLTDPECPIGKRTEGRRTHPVVAQQLAEAEGSHIALVDYFLQAGGEHNTRPYRYPLLLILRFVMQTVRHAWSAAGTHSSRARRQAGYQVWRAFEWTARLALRGKRTRVPTTLPLCRAPAYVATALWRAAVQTIPVADVLVVPLRRRALPRWQWSGSITAVDPDMPHRVTDPSAADVVAAATA